MKIVVFDSGLGSLSIIKAIQKRTKADIIYLADKKNFPYGKKTKSQLYKIITDTIQKISASFNPDVIVLALRTSLEGRIELLLFENGRARPVPPVPLSGRDESTRVAFQ